MTEFLQRQLQEAKTQIQEYAQLERDWDSYGATPFKPETLQIVEQLLDRTIGWLEQNRIWQYPGLEVSVGPCGDGSVDIYVNWRGFESIVNVGTDEKMLSAYFAPSPRRRLNGGKTAWESATDWTWSKDKVSRQIEPAKLEDFWREMFFERKWRFGSND